MHLRPVCRPGHPGFYSEERGSRTRQARVRTLTGCLSRRPRGSETPPPSAFLPANICLVVLKQREPPLLGEACLRTLLWKWECWHFTDQECDIPWLAVAAGLRVGAGFPYHLSKLGRDSCLTSSLTRTGVPCPQAKPGPVPPRTVGPTPRFCFLHGNAPRLRSSAQGRGRRWPFPGDQNRPEQRHCAPGPRGASAPRWVRATGDGASPTPTRPLCRQKHSHQHIVGTLSFSGYSS